MKMLHKKLNGRWIPVITGPFDQMDVAARLLHSGVAVMFKGARHG